MVIMIMMAVVMVMVMLMLIVVVGIEPFILSSETDPPPTSCTHQMASVQILVTTRVKKNSSIRSGSIPNQDLPQF